MTLVRLDLRELWMSFRLLAIVALMLLCGVAAVVAPAIDPRLSPLAVFAAALTMASACVAGLAAHSIAADRSGGAAAWLVVRAIPRSSLLLAWLSALCMAVLVGLASSALVAWVAAAGSVDAGPLAYLGAVIAAAAAVFVGITLGAVAGVLVRPRPAAVVATLLALGLGVAGWAVGGVPLPRGAALVAALDSARPLSEAAQSTGIALIAAALLALVADAALYRSDL